jgi:Holliday junction resolvase RusA-like endonuclease
VRSSALENGFGVVSFTVPGEPVGKPRMTRRDKWQKRDCVLRYRDYCDRIRAAAQEISHIPDKIEAFVYIAMPPSWSQRKKKEMAGHPHRTKPDGDNLLKAVCDALFEEDSVLWSKHVEKFWCWEGQERTEIRVLYRA